VPGRIDGVGGVTGGVEGVGVAAAGRIDEAEDVPGRVDRLKGNTALATVLDAPAMVPPFLRPAF